MNKRTPLHSARSIATYVDVFGRKHASVFDYVAHTKGWEMIEFIPDIEEDLHDLEGKE
jgi:hypothetical protein